MPNCEKLSQQFHINMEQWNWTENVFYKQAKKNHTFLLPVKSSHKWVNIRECQDTASL